jgi:radical SAM superfamily enzyme YgiQ (UPF0313 family)
MDNTKSDIKIKNQIAVGKDVIDIKIDLAEYLRQQHIVKSNNVSIEHKFHYEDIEEQDCLLIQVPNINESGFYAGIVALKSYVDKYHTDLKVAIIDPVIDYFFLNPPDKNGEFFNLFNTYSHQGKYWMLYEHREIFDMVNGFVFKYIDKTNPAFIGFGIIDGNVDATMAIAKLIKETYPHIKILLGGNGIELFEFGLLPASYKAKDYPFIDVFSRGDGEITFVELLKSDMSDEALSKIKGIIWWKNGELIHNSQRENINMVTLPFPDYTTLEDNYYYKSTYNNSVPLVFSRGCPYRCTFCSVPDFVPQFRYRTVDNVLDEIEHWVNKGRTNFFCHDSIINGNPKWLKEFCERVIERGWGDGVITWGGNMRLQSAMRDINTLRLYRKAGLITMITGFESASEPVLKHMKKYHNMEGVREIFENVRIINTENEWPLKFAMQIIIGYLNETEEDFQKTVEFIKEYHDVMAQILTCSVFLLHEPLRKSWLAQGNQLHNYKNTVMFDTDYNTTRDRLDRTNRIEKVFQEIGIPYSIYNRGLMIEFLKEDKQQVI